MNQLIEYQLINPSGNITAIVSGKYSINQKQIINRYIFNQNISVEQIGYIYTENCQLFFEMMGNEFSANGCRAAGYAFLMKNNGRVKFTASGLNETVEVFIKNQNSKLIFPELKVDFQKININLTQTELFGTKFFLINSQPNNDLVKKIVQKYNQPIGIMFYQQNLIYPYFYVPNIGKIIFEQSCGSGSIVLSLLTKQSKIIQPSGEILTINPTPPSISGKINFIGSYNVKIKL